MNLRYCLYTFLLLSFFTKVNAQSHAPSMQGPPVGDRTPGAFGLVVNINGTDEYSRKKDLQLRSTYTIIDGEQIAGNPYLFFEWLDGNILLKDGRQYTNYKLRYNANNQTLSFLNGNDSLDVDEDIKTFSLNLPLADSIKKLNFISSAFYKLKGAPFFLQIIEEGSTGQLLKATRKKVLSTETAILNTTTQKYLGEVSEFYFYDSQSKKTEKIAKSGNNVQHLLNLSQEESAKLGLDDVDFNNENAVVAFFHAYFALLVPKKAF